MMRSQKASLANQLCKYQGNNVFYNSHLHAWVVLQIAWRYVSATLSWMSHATSLPCASEDSSTISAFVSAWLSNSFIVSASLCMASSKVGWGVAMLLSSLGRYSPSDVAQSCPRKVVLLSTPLSEKRLKISVVKFALLIDWLADSKVFI